RRAPAGRRGGPAGPWPAAACPGRRTVRWSPSARGPGRSTGPGRRPGARARRCGGRARRCRARARPSTMCSQDLPGLRKRRVARSSRLPAAGAPLSTPPTGRSRRSWAAGRARGHGTVMAMYAADLDLALRLANRADSITGKRFRSADLRVDDKPDMTPVTDADTAVERIIRDILEIERPEDAVLGEEFGGEPAASGRQWVVDPIDGTKNFVRGVPVWATLIALFDDGVPVLGMVSAPALSRRWWATVGDGAF